MAKKKKVEEKFSVKDTSLKVEKFPIHHNETPMESKTGEDGKVVYTPSDPFCGVKIRGYFDDGKGYSGYEVMVQRYEKHDQTQWVRGKKWELAGYVKPFTFQVMWLLRSQWLSDMLGVLVKDIQNYEAVMKERIMKGAW